MPGFEPTNSLFDALPEDDELCAFLCGMVGAKLDIKRDVARLRVVCIEKRHLEATEVAAIGQQASSAPEMIRGRLH
jgi:hypothetical protein